MTLFFDARKQLNGIINNLKEIESCCEYAKKIRKLKKKLISKKIISLKTKPIESLILLHKVLKENGISSEEMIGIRKEYYIVSKTPISGNKSN